MVTEFSGLAESSGFCGAEFQQGVSKFEKDGRVEIGRRWFNKGRK